MESELMSYFKGEWDKREAIEKAADSFFYKNSSKLVLYDLGSTGGTPPPFLFCSKAIDIINFDPDPRAISSESLMTLPIAVGPPEMDKIYLNERPTTSSLLPPDQELLDRYDFSLIFGGKGNIFETISTESITSSNLDDIIDQYKTPCPDFLKIDVQGLTYEVLIGASQCLNNEVIGIQAEVEFIPSYKDQCLFSKVHDYLDSNKYEMFDISNIGRWPFKGAKKKQWRGQTAFCDLLYFKNPNECLKLWSEKPDKLIKTINLLLLFDLNDAAIFYLNQFTPYLTEDITSHFSFIYSWDSALNFFYKKIEPLPTPIIKVKEKVKIVYKDKTKQVEELWHLNYVKLFCKSLPKEIRLFGAGNYAEWFIKNIIKKSNLSIKEIIDESSQKKEILGIPVVRPDASTSRAPILLATDTFEDIFDNKCKKLFPNSETLKIYENLPPGPYRKSNS